MAVPIANPTSGTGAEDAANRIAITLSGADDDGAIDHFTIATLPANGQLFDALLGGNLLGGSSTVPASGDQATVYFQPDTDWNGSSGFDYTASQGGEDSAPATASITVNAVNDAPELNNVDPDALYIVGGAGTTVSATTTIADPDSETLSAATVTIFDFFTGDVLSVNGATSGTMNGITWSYDGAGHLSFNGTSLLIDYQSLLDLVQYSSTDLHPSDGHDTNADQLRTVEWQVNDGSLSSFVATTEVTVDFAPVLDLNSDAGATNFETTFTEDTALHLGSGPVSISDLLGTAIIDDDNGRTTSATVTLTNAKAGDVLTVVTSPVDGSLDFGSGDPISWHIDTSVAGKIIVTLTGPAPNGAPNTDFAAAIQSIDFNSTSDNPDTTDRIVEAFVNDGITDGPTATTTIHVVSINDAPANTVPPRQTIDEDHDLVFSAANGNAITTTDVDVEAGNPTVTLSVNHGVLTLGAIPAGLVFSTGDGATDGTMTFTGTVSDINSALDGLLYHPDTNFNGTGAAAEVLTITTNDNGNTGVDPDGLPPGQASEEATSTVTIEVNSVNDAPEGANVLKTIQEDQSYTFTTADFGFTDPNDSPSNALTFVIIATPPAAGSLTLNDVAVTAGQAIAVADITAGNLKFAPAANGNGSNYAQITFQVMDNGGTANGGVDTDQSANTITFDVTPVNGPPSGTDVAKTIVEDQPFTTFTAADFGFSDSDDPADTFLSVVIASTEAGGVLTLGGNNVVAGQEIPVGDIGNLVFTPTTDLNGGGAGGFTFQVKDNGGTLDGGVDTDPSAKTFAFNIDSVIDAFGDSAVSVEDHVTTINVLANDTFSDPVAAITGVTNGAHGSVAIGANGNVVYTPDANFRGADAFTYTVTAGGVTETANVHIDMVLQAPPPPGTAPMDGDFQGDRFGDLFVYEDSGPAAIWQMHEGARLDSGTNLPDNGPTWHAKAFTDLDSTEGFSDIVWQNDNGAVAVWQMYSVNVIDQVNLPNPGAATHVRDAQDFDGNGGGDILLQNDNGALTIWMMQDAIHIGSAVTIDQNPGASWKAAVAGDFNGDGQAGILFTTSNGDTAIWEDYATSSPGHGRFDLQANLPGNGPTWHLKAAADFDGDNKDDILWQNDNGLAAVWLMDGVRIKDGFTITGTGANGPTWHIITARDMNHDSRADLLFQNDIGQVAVWEDFTPTPGTTTATFTSQLNISPELNPTGHLFWHIL